MNFNKNPVRDTARTAEFYTGMITKLESFTKKVQVRLLNENDQIKKDSMRNLIFMNYLSIAKVMYCRGDELIDLKVPVVDALAFVTPMVGDDIVGAVYVDVLDFASLAILLNMPEKVFQDLKSLADYSDGRDQVLDHLISSGTRYKPGEAGQSALMIRTNLDNAIDCCKQNDTKNVCSEHLLNFLEHEWHKKQMSGANVKYRSDPELPYDGLYCFKVAALAHINELDDTELRKSDYYPIDIADFARTA